MAIAIIPLLVCLLGVVLWALGPDKSKGLAMHMFWCGLLVLLLTTANVTWKIG